MCQGKGPVGAEAEERGRARAESDQYGSGMDMTFSGQGQEQGRSQCRARPDQGEATRKPRREDRQRGHAEEQHAINGYPQARVHHLISRRIRQR